MTKGTKRFIKLCDAVWWANQARACGFTVVHRGLTVCVS